MPTVREFFLSESNGYLERLGAMVDSAAARGMSSQEMQRLARGLRGSAQMAEAESVRSGAQVLEAVARALASGQLQWNPDTERRTRESLEDLRSLVRGGEGAAQQEVRLTALQSRWEDRGVRPGPATTTTSDAGFGEFAVRELTAITSELDGAIGTLTRAPMDREPLKAILRRQRALAGAARLTEMPPVAETVQVIDDITRMIARLNVPVTGPWHELYRAARDVLATAIASIQHGETVEGGAPLARLRALRETLSGNADAAAEPVAKRDDESDVQPIDNFLYVGAAALDRALELREPIERAVAGDPDALEATAELFDLIRLARS